MGLQRYRLAEVTAAVLPYCDHASSVSLGLLDMHRLFKFQACFARRTPSMTTPLRCLRPRIVHGLSGLPIFNSRFHAALYASVAGAKSRWQCQSIICFIFLGPFSQGGSHSDGLIRPFHAIALIPLNFLRFLALKWRYCLSGDRTAFSS